MACFEIERKNLNNGVEITYIKESGLGNLRLF